MTRHTVKILILGSMLVSVNLYAATQPEEQKASAASKAAAEKHRPLPEERSRKPAKPANTFRPSGKISADSAVSFPVDI